MKTRTMSSFWDNSPNFRGAFWKISALMCFSIINGLVRYLSQNSEALGVTPMPAYEVAFFQNLFGLLFLIPWLWQSNTLTNLRTKWPLMQLSRLVLSAVGVVLWYLSLSYMSLARAVALMLLGPLITAIGARIFLKETVGPSRTLAILIGFIGAIFVSQSTFDLGFEAVILLPILAATCFSGATLMVRRLTSVDSSELIVTYLLLFMAPTLLIPTWLYGAMPHNWEWAPLLMMGALSACAHLFLSHAYATAEVSYLIPYGFTKWVASSMIGFVAFSEVPSFWTCVGALIMVLAIAVLSIQDAAVARQTAKKSIILQS